MTWDQCHSESEALATAAEAARRDGDVVRAEQLYRQAGKAETAALEHLTSDKIRTRGITGVSAVALWYKGHDYERAERLAHSLLADGHMATFAEAQLRDLLSLLWSAQTAERGGVRFVSGDVLVSVQGGLVAHGGAPLDLIVQKVENVKAMLYRTAEMLLQRPFRKHGGPPIDVLEMFRPWLFQAPAGSYQFAVRIQEPPQLEIWRDERPKVQQVTDAFFTVLRASAGDPATNLASVVPHAEYRTAFLKLARNLAPSKGKTFERLTVREAGSPSVSAVSFATENRQEINTALREARPQAAPEAGDRLVTLEGVLVGVHVSKHWLEVVAGEAANIPGGLIHIDELGEVLDDVVGPMVNRRVVVTALRRRNKYFLRDIELDE